MPFVQSVDPLECQRERFDIPADITFLNCANMSPQLRSVSQAGMKAVQARAAPWTITAPDWFSGAERLRSLFARIVNTDAEGIALVPSASYGIAIAAANVRVRPGQSIVLLDREFPSNVYAWRALAGREGGRIRTVRREPGMTWAEAVIDAIDGSTAVVTVPNCHWTDGSLVDIVSVGAVARASGAVLVVDASQSLGACPLDVALVQPDFLVTVGYKWLMGPYGLGYLYAAPRWRQTGVPIEQSWLTRAGSEDFTRLTDYTDSYRAGARRFDAGEFPQFVTLPMAIVALEQILAWGVDRIQETLGPLTSRVAEGAALLGATAPPPEDRVRHMVGIRLPLGVPTVLAASLGEAKVHVSLRGDSIRVAPHLYNDRRDIERFLRVLRIGLGAGPR